MKKIMLLILLVCMLTGCSSDTVEIDLTLTDYQYLKTWWPPGQWRSTGLYAHPKTTVNILVPEHVEGLWVQIGSHTDTLETIPENDRLRAGNVVSRFPLEKGSNRVTSEHGGLIYIVPTQQTDMGMMDIQITGAEKVPYYILYQSDEEAWKNAFTNVSAPYVELESQYVILTVPTEKARLVENPYQLMETWDTFIGHMYWLAGLSHDDPINKIPYDKWRYVADVQISYGYMYAGYPIMLYDDPCIDALLSIEGLTQDGWGFWHELGHNLQQYNWEMDSMIEVTNNIFSLYISEVFGAPDRLAQDNDGTGYSSRYDARQYLLNESKEKNFHDDSQTTFFTRLVMFEDLKNLYGWDFYPSLFTAFRQGDDSQLLTLDQRVDALIALSSQIAGEDLTHFFEAWGLKRSQQ